jgi:hypothetical protein
VKQIQTLATCHFIEHGENVVLLGPYRLKEKLKAGLVRPAEATE